MSEKIKQFSDKGEMLYDFGDEFLVICPKCALPAKVIPVENAEMPNRRKLFCSNCGYNKPTNVNKNLGMSQLAFSNQRNTNSYVVISGAFDWYFRESLWLQNRMLRRNALGL